MSWYSRWNYSQSTPKKLRGGIKAQSARGRFGKSWWARRWIRVLESFRIGARLERGRVYARQGQVASIDIREGLVTAAVQGSRAEPYKIKIGITPLSEQDWMRLAASVFQQALVAAKLLSGEMPADMEDSFAQVGLSLFPDKNDDLKTYCSCPDWSNPCKHIAAVYYLLGEEFDRDPFLIFKLRGMSRERLVSLLVQEPAAGANAKSAGKGKRRQDGKTAPKGARQGEKTRAGKAGPAGTGGTESTVLLTGTEGLSAPHDEPLEGQDQPDAHVATPEPLPADFGAFWGTQAAQGVHPAASVEIPRVAAPLVRQLGAMPFWRADVNFLNAMEGIYREASAAAMRTLASEG